MLPFSINECHSQTKKVFTQNKPNKPLIEYFLTHEDS